MDLTLNESGTSWVNGEVLGRLYGAVFGVRAGESAPTFNADDAYVIAAAVNTVFGTLTPREEKVLKMRFGIGMARGQHTLEEVGQHYAVTRQRIKQIEAKALRKLRHPARSKRLLGAIDDVRDPGRAPELILDHLSLTEVPEFILKFHRIHTLSLSSNQLRTLPEFLSQLTNLQRIDLDHNQLTTLPECLRELPNLSMIDVSTNQLTALPEFLGELSNLRLLSLFDNSLTELPNTIGELTQLEYLTLNKNLLTTLPSSMGHLKKLEYFDLRGNQLV